MVAFVLLLFAGCGGDGEDSTSATNGAALYAASCASCHGKDLRGTDMGPSHLSVVYERDHHPDDSFRRAVESGVRAHHWQYGDMAPIPELSADQITAIIAYVREVQSREGLEPYPPG
jgi:mono/diheme cytochrome c family protein